MKRFLLILAICALATGCNAGTTGDDDDTIVNPPDTSVDALVIAELPFAGANVTLDGQDMPCQDNICQKQVYDTGTYPLQVTKQNYLFVERSVRVDGDGSYSFDWSTSGSYGLAPNGHYHC
ncbi:MAG: hypothetical protein ABIH21_04685, partial [Patescibacteria group bacterium]